MSARIGRCGMFAQQIPCKSQCKRHLPGTLFPGKKQGVGNAVFCYQREQMLLGIGLTYDISKKHVSSFLR